MNSMSFGSSPNVDCIWSATSSGCAAGKSIYPGTSPSAVVSGSSDGSVHTLLSTGMTVSPRSRAIWKTESDCACTPCVASTRSSAPWQAESERETSQLKST
jgi:hypothetical protein